MEYKGMNGKSPKPKVVFVLGATATGKSKLAIALAKKYNGEVINSDKIQMYDGVPIITNKVTLEECAGVPHHLLGGVHPDADYTAEDFCRDVSAAIARVLAAGSLPIIAGGSNTYIEALVEGDNAAFRAGHDCLFVWLDAKPDMMEWYTAKRVDDMVKRGLVQEARAVFDAGNTDYSRGVRRAIGLPEMHEYLLLLDLLERDGAVAEAVELVETFDRAVRDIKANTFALVLAQQAKIQRLSTMEGWDVRRIDATIVVGCMSLGFGQEAWETIVWEPCEKMMKLFLETPTFFPDAADNLPTDQELEDEMAKVFLGSCVSPNADGREVVLALPAARREVVLALPAPRHEVVLALPAAPRREVVLALPAAPRREVVLALPAVRPEFVLALPEPRREGVLALPAVREDEGIENGAAAGTVVDGDGGNAGVGEAAGPDAAAGAGSHAA